MGKVMRNQRHLLYVGTNPNTQLLTTVWEPR
jgi:hypothetical protein